MDKITYSGGNTRIKGETIRKSGGILDNILTKIFFIVISVILLYNVFHSFKIMFQKKEILNRARIEVERLRLTNLELEITLEDMQSVEYLEIQARDRLNFGGEKEFVFVIPDEVMADYSVKLQEIVSTKPVVSSRRGHEVWVDFIVRGI